MIISIAQIIISVILIVLILLQERSSGVSGVFGGGGSEFYSQRRGLERLIFYATIVLIVAFVVLSLLNLGYSQ
ncbi:MAG: preprotein translocase subunit SecG [Patescibacteria group bacterium]